MLTLSLLIACSDGDRRSSDLSSEEVQATTSSNPSTHLNTTPNPMPTPVPTPSPDTDNSAAEYPEVGGIYSLQIDVQIIDCLGMKTEIPAITFDVELGQSGNTLTLNTVFSELQSKSLGMEGFLNFEIMDRDLLLLKDRSVVGDLISTGELAMVGVITKMTDKIDGHFTANGWVGTFSLSESSDIPGMLVCTTTSTFTAVKKVGGSACTVESIGPVVNILNATDAETEGVIEYITIRDLFLEDYEVDLEEYDIEDFSNIVIDYENNSLQCTLPCGFLQHEGNYSFSVSSPGYMDKTISLAAGYSVFTDGCPASRDEGSVLSISLQQEP